MCYTRRKLTRGKLRHTDNETKRKPTGAYEEIADRLGAMADQDERTARAPEKIEQFAVCALRG